VTLETSTWPLETGREATVGGGVRETVTAPGLVTLLIGAKMPEENNKLIYLFYVFIYLNTFKVHYPRVSSKRFTFTFTPLAMLPG
jgi:hypothetical protein